MLKKILEIKPSNRPWHLPVIAGVTIGIPIVFGYFMDSIEEGKLASLAALVILYIQSNHLIQRMKTLIICSFLIILSFTVGVVFSFNAYFAPLALGLFAAFIHYTLNKFKMTKPPGNFFFIMVASMAICLPFDLKEIPIRVGYVSIGAMLALILGFIYSLFVLKINHQKKDIVRQTKTDYIIVTESLIIGLFVAISLFVPRLLKLDNPYWVPITCMAVMQGLSAKHIWIRGIQRVLGTVIGLLFVWLILQMNPSVLTVCLTIVVAQIIIEFLIVRNYLLAVIVITILTVFLAEASHIASIDPNQLLSARLVDIFIGSIIGALGGWVMHNRKIYYYSTKKLRRTRGFFQSKNRF